VPFSSYHDHNPDELGVVDTSKWVIRWEESNVMELPKYLDGLSHSEISEMQRAIFRIRSRYLYSQDGWELHPDATDTLLEGLARRFHKKKGSDKR